MTILAAAPLGSGASSVWAQGGVAAAMAEGDSPESHARDTCEAGAGIVDAQAALDMAREAPERIRDLLAFGVPFDRDLEGRLQQSREAAHSHRRIVRVGGDAAGRAIMEALVAAVRATPSIVVLEHVVLEAPIVRDGRFAGVLARDAEGILRPYFAAETILATGGVGHLYRVTTNPPQARGDGLAVAALAGAFVADAEFVQFHPTAIDVGRDPAPLATEALRGEGALLVDRTGRRFMTAIHPDAELAPRDVVARAVAVEISAGRGAFLDAREHLVPRFAERFPTVADACRRAGFDPAATPIPIAPAAHYHMGGVASDARGRSSVPGLRVVGETASTGVHGANRLASNSLLEAVVFAARIAQDLASLQVGPIKIGDPIERRQITEDGGRAQALRALMADRVGVVRCADGLTSALRELAAFERDAANARERNASLACFMIAAAALRRTESRGAHARSDYPSADPAWAKRMSWTLEDARHYVAKTAGL